jgi:D-ribose pyranase
MRKQGILHAELARQISLLGHTDTVVIGDCGLPLPRDIPLIDLALIDGQLDFRTVLDAVLGDVVVQRHIVARESAGSPAGQWLDERSLGERVEVSHEELKERIARCAFAIRTGERTPYANVILESGVPF